MRMPGTQIWFESCGEDGFLHAFVDQEKLRMTGADTCPNDARFATGGESSETGDRKEERLVLHQRQLFAQSGLVILRERAEKAEGQMNLVALEPAHSREVRIEFGQRLADDRREIERNEEPFGHALNSLDR